MIMGLSDADSLYTKAMELFYKEDSRCIQLFEQVGDSRSRVKLASIYNKGMLGVEKDYNKALEYCNGNYNLIAVSLECEIRVFKLKQENYYSIAIERLSQLYVKAPDNKKISLLYSRMFFQGLGIEPFFQKAVIINPEMAEEQLFKKELKFCSQKVKEILLDQILELVTNKPAYYVLAGYVCYSLKKYDDGFELFCKAIAYGINKYDVVVDFLIHNGRKYEALEFAMKGFEKDKSSKMAHTYAKAIYNNGASFSEIEEFLFPYKDNLICLRFLMFVARETMNQPKLKEYVEYAISNDYPIYDSIGRYFLDNGDSIGAILWYQKDLDYCKKSSSMSFTESALRLFTIKHDVLKEDDIDLAYLVLKTDKLADLHHVGCILVYSPYEGYRKVGLKLLEKASQKGYDQSTIKLLELSKVTVDQEYVTELESRLKNNPESKYIFNETDLTEVITARYMTLPLKIQLRALKELFNRFYKGNKGEFKDISKAYECIEAYLEISSPEMDYCYNDMQAIKGHIMYTREYPNKNDDLAVKLMFPKKNAMPFLRDIADAYINGRGIEKDVQKGIEMLDKTNHLSSIRYLAQLYNEGGVVEADHLRAFEYTKDIILKSFKLLPFEIDSFVRLSKNCIEIPTTRSLELCNVGKAEYLFRESSNWEYDPLYKIRLVDYSRKCGNQYALQKEIHIIAVSFKKYRLAYSLLMTDPNAETFEKQLQLIPDEDRVLVDIDQELQKIFSSYAEIKFLIDGEESSIAHEYIASFFNNRHSFKLINVNSPIRFESLDLNIKTIYPIEEGNSVTLDYSMIKKNIMLAPISEATFCIYDVETDKELASFHIICGGSYELAGYDTLLSKLVFNARYHFSKDGVISSAICLITENITYIDGKGYDRIVIEEERSNNIWVQVAILDLPCTLLNSLDKEKFLTISAGGITFIFSKQDFSGYIDDFQNYRKIYDIIREKVVAYKIPVEVASIIQKQVESELMNYICDSKKGLFIVDRIAKISRFDLNFAEKLYHYADNLGEDVYYARYIFQ